jgi:LytS/YehU family sensor histidine kinase
VEKLELKASLKEAELNTLKGQINPHFMFNSLNNIRGLMLEDVSKSREMLTKLSELLRYSLTKNATDKILLSEELEMVHNYIALSKIQFEDRLIYKENIEVTINEIEIPPMLIQLLIENAIKHGISSQTNGGIVTLKIFKNNNNLHIEVKNTGELKLSKNTTKLGLQNIKKRLFLLYGEQASFSLSQEKNNVIANIVIPLNK